MSDVPDGFGQQLSRFIVGIDLGTTNCAIAYSEGGHGDIHCFPVQQWVDLNLLEPRELLPSFHYQPLDSERLSFGGDSAIVGVAARDRGGQLPGRLIASAKSWLCHAGVDRTSPILPWQNDEGVEKLSPVAASSAYLRQIRDAWDRSHPNDPLAAQDIVLTLPASFDQVARQLTVDAAKQAGLERLMPIEEPQAAFYAWLARHEGGAAESQDRTWDEIVHPGQTILVCDIGGGTTDFTLIRVRQGDQPAFHDGRSGGDLAELEGPAESAITLSARDGSEQPRVRLHRVAVGQHLILGGDNIDLALARLVEAKLTGGKILPPRTWDALLASCRRAKESLLGDNAPESFTIHLPGSGSRLIGSGSQVEITRDEVRQVVLDGFFPKVSLSERPIQQQSGFQEFGLPYAQDAAVTHHLAAFLWDHRSAGRADAELQSMDERSQARPDWILFNGGVMTSAQLRERLIRVISDWFAGQDNVSSDWRIGVLEGERLDLAVAMGAAYFGRVRRGLGVEIEAKLSSSYYLQVATDPPRAICIVPGSASPGDTFVLGQALELAVGQPVQFPILYSSTRLADASGQHVELNSDEFAWLPPIRTVLDAVGRRRRELLRVELKTELTEIGTLKMWFQSLESPQRWRLEFDVRASTQTDVDLQESLANRSGTLDESAELAVRGVLERAFGSGQPSVKPSKVVYELSQAIGIPRHDWPPQLLRAIWQTLIELQDGRKKSQEHELRWLNLLGYTLRPGFGMAGDDWRVAETWRNVHGKLAFGSLGARNEATILWRRIAGGFTPGQQLTVYQQIIGPLRQVLDPARRIKGGGAHPNDLIEPLRLAGSLELLPKGDKVQLGRWAIELLDVPKYNACHGALLWCIGRLGARQPSYGPLNSVIETTEVETWIDRLLVKKFTEDAIYDLAMLLLARRVGDRYRDVSDEFRQRVVSHLESRGGAAHYVELIRLGGRLASEEAALILGDQLPLGIRV